MTTRRLRLLAAVLLVISAALFAIGVAIERHATGTEKAAQLRPAAILLADADQNPAEAPRGGTETTPRHREPSGSHESHSAKPAKPETNPTERSRESASGHEASSSGETAAEHAREKKREEVFGINTESTPLVIAAVALSLLLAAALLRSDAVFVLAAVIGFALIAAVFDVREAFHQADESRTNLIVIAAIVAALHLIVAASAVMLTRLRTASRA